MSAFTVEKIARAVSGKLISGMLPPDYPVVHLSVDSRTLLNPEGTVYFALRGVRNDGHQYVEELVSRGVKVFVVSSGYVPPSFAESAFIAVEDTLVALQRLAAFHRLKFTIPVIGITGSNGKTIVKEWLHDLLAGEFSIVRSPKSYNSQTGVPLSVWLMSGNHNLAVFEAGISEPGEMEKLAPVIRPTIGILTHIGDAHQEYFISLEQKIEEKLLLFAGCEKLVFCMDQPLVAAMVPGYCRRHGIEPLGWSLHDRSAPLWFDAEGQNGTTTLTAVREEGTVTFSLPFSDESSLENGCHCFATILALGVDPLKVAGRFTLLESLSMRLELKKGIHGAMLLNDFYNSDINSLEIALSVLNRQAEKNHLEKVVILSDIRQSGLPPDRLYRQVNNLLSASGVKRLIGIGSAIHAAGDIFSMEKQFFSSTGEFLKKIRRVKLSQAALLIKGARDFRFEEISEALQEKAHQTILEINLNALVENLNIFRGRLLPGTKIMVMVKAFSYGSGDVEIARILQYNRVDYLAVAVTDEGKELREGGVTLPIIVMNPEQHSFQQMIDYRLEPNLYSVELAGQFYRTAALNAVRDFPVHLKIDTGMNRLGLKSEEEVAGVVASCRVHSVLRVQSLFSHLAASDDPAMDQFTLGQIRRFRELGDLAAGMLEYPVMRHILNSAGIERFGDYQLDMVRLGIGLYGVSTTGLPLKPISRLKSTLSQIKEVLPGETVGYNRSGVVVRPSRIAVVPVGYADGLDRRLGNGNGMVAIRGSMAPLIGNICMDMCMVDVTDVACEPGDEAEFFGERIPVSEVAERAGTIPYEILTGISQRVKRIYIQD